MRVWLLLVVCLATAAYAAEDVEDEDILIDEDEEFENMMPQEDDGPKEELKLPEERVRIKHLV